MDMFEEVAARRWQETETDVSKITEIVLAHPGNEGWAIASIYSYHYDPDTVSYSVTIWKSSGTKNGFAIVQIKGMMVIYNEATGLYEMAKIVKVL